MGAVVDERTYATLRATAEDIMSRYDAWGVEIGREGITLMMSPLKRHELITKRLGRQIDAQAEAMPEELIAHSGPEVESARLARMRRPDLVVVPEAALDEEGRYLDPADVRLVAEVVSDSNPENDYTEKTADYAAMGIPVYLLIDPRTSTVVVYTEPGPAPQGPRYRTRRAHTFGERVAAGPFTVDSSEFPAYDS
jgi:Uma2 family endonuclease